MPFSVSWAAFFLAEAVNKNNYHFSNMFDWH